MNYNAWLSPCMVNEVGANLARIVSRSPSSCRTLARRATESSSKSVNYYCASAIRRERNSIWRAANSLAPRKEHKSVWNLRNGAAAFVRARRRERVIERRSAFPSSSLATVVARARNPLIASPWYRSIRCDRVSCRPTNVGGASLTLRYIIPFFSLGNDSRSIKSPCSRRARTSRAESWDLRPSPESRSQNFCCYFCRAIHHARLHGQNIRLHSLLNVEQNFFTRRVSFDQ